jgi:hypothetical protein
MLQSFFRDQSRFVVVAHVGNELYVCGADQRVSPFVYILWLNGSPAGQPQRPSAHNTRKNQRRIRYKRTQVSQVDTSPLRWSLLAVQ